MSTQEFYAQFDGISSILKAFAYKLTQDMERSKDLYQETLYKALKNKDKFTLGTNFKAWMTTIMRNTFINDFRRKKTSKTQSVPHDSLYIKFNTKTVDNSGLQTLTEEEINGMIDELDDKLKVPFMMFFVGYRYHEIAKKLDLPLGTVKSRIHNARKILQAQVKAAYPTLNRG
ncbi:MAG: RNA polymerase sigma factor [Saprospiraceae bacterium]|nr:RNA polymerase sigma factor [Saprospiraceae bacterium]